MLKKRGDWNRRGSMSLSINAIVIVVLAFVMLGLGLTITRTIFDSTAGKIPEAIDLTALDAVPSAENPITISDNVVIKRGKSITQNIGYYNTDSDTHTGVFLKINDCIDPDTGESVDPDGVALADSKLPVVTTIKQDVGPSESKGYSTIIKERSKLQGGKTYICEFVATADTATPEGAGYTVPYESKQIFLKVTA